MNNALLASRRPPWRLALSLLVAASRVGCTNSSDPAEGEACVELLLASEAGPAPVYGCAPSLVCNVAATPPACARAETLPAGSPCAAGLDVCAPGLECNLEAADSSQTPPVPATCQVPGSVSAGGACSSDALCASGTTCNRGKSPPTCAVPGAVGDACASPDDCAAGLSCDVVNVACVAASP